MNYRDELPTDVRNRLVTLLSDFGRIETVVKRRAFLEGSGLNILLSKLTLEGETHLFAGELIRECRLKGQLPEGEYAFELLLAQLEKEVVGHPDHLAFVKGLRRPTTAAATRTDTLEPPSLDFTGRETEQQRIITALRSGRPVMLSGMGGIGKSDLARKVADTLKPDFPDAALQIELQPSNVPVSALEVVGSLILALHPHTKLPDTLAERVAILRPLMQGKRGILLLDNAATREQIQPLEQLWRGWAVLITSRADWIVQGARLERLGPMTASDAEALLLTITENAGRPLNTNEAAAVAECCHYHPLALHVAGAYLGVRDHTNIEDYLERVRTIPMSALVAPEYITVAQVLGVSIEQLHQSNPTKSHHWHLLAWMPDAFDTDLAAALLGELHGNQYPTITPLAAATTQSTLDTFCRLNLLDTLPASPDHPTVRYRLHDFLTDYALHHSPHRPIQAAQDTAVRCHALSVLKQGSTADELYQAGKPIEALTQFDALWTHLNSAWQRLNQAQDTYGTYFLNRFTGSMPYLLTLRLSPRTHIPYHQVALRAAQERQDRSGEAVHLGNLGLAYANLGEVRTAIDYYKQTLIIARELNEKQRESIQLGNLGNAYAALGEVRTAIDYHEHALLISREIGDRRGEGNHLGNLGLEYADLGEVRTAIDYYEQALLIAREIGDRRTEGSALGALGIAYKNLGEVRTAIGYYEQSLVMSRDIGDRRNEGIHSWNLALAFDKENQREQAIEYARHALTLFIAIEAPYVEQVRTQLREWGVSV